MLFEDVELDEVLIFEEILIFELLDGEELNIYISIKIIAFRLFDFIFVETTSFSFLYLV